MQFRLAHVITLLIAVSIIACKSDLEEPQDPGYDYFPLEIGHWISYQVDSAVHDHAVGIHDHYSYQVKELVESSFIDNEGDEAFRIERSWRSDDSEPWVLRDIWTSKRTNTLAEKVEENVRYTRLVFPARLGKEWDNNASNVHETWDSEILGVANLYDNGTTVFDDVCEVSIINSFSAVDADIGQQVYAKGIGLVFHRLDTVEFSYFPYPIGVQWVDSSISVGKEYKMIYIEHGVE